jgi:WD40 repeat protein
LTSSSGTLLTYAFTTLPDPLAANGSATLTLAVSNLGTQVVTVTSVTVTLPRGTNAKDLTADPSGITTVPPAGWDMSQVGAAFTLTPQTPAAAKVGQHGLAFVFAGVAVNTEPGTCAVAFDELASSPSQPSAHNATTVILSKFPAQFSLSDMTAKPVEVDSGTGTTTLNWTGSPATYTLSYDPDGKGLQTISVPNAGPLGVTNLTDPHGLVVFTLDVQWPVPGQDDPATAQRQAIVGVIPPDPVITSFTGTLTGAGTRSPQLALAWTVTGVQWCSLSTDPGVLRDATSGTVIVPSATTPLRATYTLSATNALGTKTVSSTIVVNWAARPSTIALSDTPINLTMPRSGTTAYACCWQSVVAIDMLALQLIGQPLPTRGTGGSGIVSPDGSLLYQLNCLGFQPNSVTVYNPLTSQQVGQPIVVSGVLPQYSHCVLSPDGSQLFITGAKGTIVVDTRMNAEVAQIGAYMQAGGFSPDGTAMLASDGYQTISVIDPAARTVIGQIATATRASEIPFTPDGTRAYVSRGGSIEAVDVATRTPVTPPASVPLSCDSLAVMPDGGHLVASAPGAVAILAAKPLQLVSSVQFSGQSTSDVVVSPDGVVVLVSDSGANTVTVLLPESVTGGVPAPHADRAALRSEANAGTLLSYAILPAPNPLAVSAGATLTLAVSNGGTQLVTVTSITLTIPVGTNAKDLMAGTAVATTPPAGWTVAQSGGSFTLAPTTPAAAKVGANGLVFVFSSIAVNAQPGTSTITIVEEASSPAQPLADRTAPIAVQKFPASFALSELTGPGAPIVQGGSASLMWAGSQATYTLTYDPDGNGAQTVPVGTAGPYIARNLTAPIVVFTLVATVTVPGQDRPLVTQRQFVVTVTTVSIVFTALPTSVGPNGVAKLTWTTSGAASVTVNPRISTALSGQAYVIVPETQTFSLLAKGGTGPTIEQQQTVTVDPSIVPTSTMTFSGTPGYPGSPGLAGAPGRPGGPGGPGGPGTPASSATVPLGPLDTSSAPASVVQIVYGGGDGGRGGDGGASGGGGTAGGAGGPGGSGGAAGRLTLQLGALSTPQQIVVDNRAAHAGGGGNGANGSPNGPPGDPGNLGTIAIVEG